MESLFSIEQKIGKKIGRFNNVNITIDFSQRVSLTWQITWRRDTGAPYDAESFWAVKIWTFVVVLIVRPDPDDLIPDTQAWNCDEV